MDALLGLERHVHRKRKQDCYANRNAIGEGTSFESFNKELTRCSLLVFLVPITFSRLSKYQTTKM